MNRLFLLLSVALVSIHPSATAQLVKYSPKGEKINITSDRLFIYVDPDTGKHTMSGAGPLSLPNIMGSFLTGTFTIMKALVSSEQEKYSASYTQAKTERGLIYLFKPGNRNTAALNISSITIDRITDIYDTALEIVLVPIPDAQSGLFRLVVTQFYEPFAKAKIKRGGKLGKTLDLSVDIKLDAIWKEPGVKPDSQNVSLKTGSLGESTVILPGISPGKRYSFKKEDAQYESGWYQTLPSTALIFATENTNWTTGWYTLTVTIKEANPYAYNSKQLSDFLNSSAGDISNFLKQFIPASGK
jgi:hypothetical protein